MAAKKTALITGVTGQDGSYLAELLLKKNYIVAGIVRKTSNMAYANISHIQEELNLIQADLLDPISIREAMQKVKPDEVYNLASQSHPAESFRQPIHTAEITAIGAHRVLDATLDVVPKARFYQASSSEMYGWVKEIRTALGMTGSQLAKRMKVATPTLKKIEISETKGTITMSTLKRAAEALDCQLVYVLLPKTSSKEPLNTMVQRRARRVAEKMVANISQTMGLEKQGIGQESKQRQIDEIAAELLQSENRKLWED